MFYSEFQVQMAGGLKKRPLTLSDQNFHPYETNLDLLGRSLLLVGVNGNLAGNVAAPGFGSKQFSLSCSTYHAQPLGESDVAGGLGPPEFLHFGELFRKSVPGWWMATACQPSFQMAQLPQSLKYCASRVLWLWGLLKVGG